MTLATEPTEPRCFAGTEMIDLSTELPVKMTNARAVSSEKRGLQMLIGGFLIFTIMAEVFSLIYRHESPPIAVLIIAILAALLVYITFFRNVSDNLITVVVDTGGVNVRRGKYAIQYSWPDINGTNEIVEAHTVGKKAVTIRSLVIQRKGDLAVGTNSYAIREGAGLDIRRIEELIAAGVRQWG